MPILMVRPAMLTLVLIFTFPLVSRGDDEKAAKQLNRLDAEFLKSLGELARKYDKDQIPEAAHFFAGCALGLGSTDVSMTSIKASYEAAVYLGKLRGGEPLKETATITGLLGNLSYSYKKILDPWIARARKGSLADVTRKLMFETGVKYELARGAHEYVQAIQRFNALRRAMGTRAVLWDFEGSRKLILSGWYTCETEDGQLENIRKDSPFYNEGVEAAKPAGRGVHKLPEFPEVLRSFVRVRQNLLNPNARNLMLGYWGGGSQIDYWGLYEIPLVPYRADIPTPSKRFEDETLVKDWVDLEDTVIISGKTVPYVRYPYPGEVDLPVWFSNGKGASEEGWAKSEHETLDHGGLPIMIRVFAACVPTEVEANLTRKDGVRCKCRIYLNGDERVHLEKWATILLLPEQQLDGLTDYIVSVKCRLGTTGFEKSWTFKTRAK